MFNFPTARRLRSVGFANALGVPEYKLESALDRRILGATHSGKPLYDEAVFRPLRDLAAPRYFFDLQTVQSPVRIWAGTRPFQQIPLQSLHCFATLD
ncbi:DUF2779 domain-containing protein [Caballeronia grimmiae]|uniref:DUF2779 domain-containing protein n=1 Tax=Caballeronia grimmiae TaxID=1071679 RepID=UPI0038BCC37B